MAESTENESYRFTITNLEDGTWSGYSKSYKLTIGGDTKEELCSNIKERLGEDRKMKCQRRKNKWVFTYLSDNYNNIVEKNNSGNKENAD